MSYIPWEISTDLFSFSVKPCKWFLLLSFYIVLNTLISREFMNSLRFSELIFSLLKLFVSYCSFLLLFLSFIITLPPNYDAMTLISKSLFTNLSHFIAWAEWDLYLRFGKFFVVPKYPLFDQLCSSFPILFALWNPHLLSPFLKGFFK